jgi:hypothetical protein
VKYSEGNSYNILQHTISNEANMKVSGKLSQGHISHANEIQKKQRDAGIARLELEEQRSLNRPNFNRWKSDVDRVYGLIDNQPKEPRLPYPKRPATVWTRLQESGSCLSNNAVSGEVRSAGHTPFVYPDSNTSSDMPRLSPIVRPATTTLGNPSLPNSRAQTNRNVPALDLTAAEPPELVSYKDVPGPPGLAIPIVRTGGMSKM